MTPDPPERHEPPTPDAPPRWVWAKRIGAALFLAVVAYLIFQQARQIDWLQVLHTLLNYPPTVLLQAGAVAALGLLLYSVFDVVGRRYTGHRLGTGAVMRVGFISYVLNLNLGSLIGGVALRFRLYSRLGLDYAVITQLVGFSMLTNWLGYVLLAGLAFTLSPLSLPPSWDLNSHSLHWLGWAMLALGVAYLLLCALAKQRTWCVRGRQLALPSGPLASGQALLGMTNWLLMGAVVYVLMPPALSYVTVTTVLLVAAVAGLITHVPGNLGVLEAVFVALLGHQVAAHQLLAALLGYRLLYYLIPLVVASAAYFYAEAKAQRPSPTPP